MRSNSKQLKCFTGKNNSIPRDNDTLLRPMEKQIHCNKSAVRASRHLEAACGEEDSSGKKKKKSNIILEFSYVSLIIRKHFRDDY